jgi:hypothetical protein
MAGKPQKPSGFGPPERASITKFVAPDFAQGALEKECSSNDVTPMRAGDLARLVMLTAGCGTDQPSGFSRGLYPALTDGCVNMDRWIGGEI